MPIGIEFREEQSLRRNAHIGYPFHRKLTEPIMRVCSLDAPSIHSLPLQWKLLLTISIVFTFPRMKSPENQRLLPEQLLHNPICSCFPRTVTLLQRSFQLLCSSNPITYDWWPPENGHSSASHTQSSETEEIWVNREGTTVAERAMKNQWWGKWVSGPQWFQWMKTLQSEHFSIHSIHSFTKKTRIGNTSIQIQSIGHYSHSSSQSIPCPQTIQLQTPFNSL